MALINQKKKFIELIKEQFELMQSADNNYNILYIYVQGDNEPYLIEVADEMDIDEKNNIMVLRDGPTDREANEGIPERVIKIDFIVATSLEVK